MTYCVWVAEHLGPVVGCRIDRPLSAIGVRALLELVFKKYFWTAQVGFAVVAALLLAGAVNGFFARTYAEYSVAVPETAMEALPAGADSPTIPIEINPDGMPRAAADEEPDRCAEVECEEDEECNPETGECEPVEEAEVETGPDGRCIESDIAINLVGTMVADDPEWSVAILRNPSLNQTQFATLGTNLLAEADVTRIERNRIFIVRNGREECLRPGTATDRQRRAGSSSGRSATPESPRSGSRPVRRDTRSTASAGMSGMALP